MEFSTSSNPTNSSVSKSFYDVLMTSKSDFPKNNQNKILPLQMTETVEIRMTIFFNKKFNQTPQKEMARPMK